MEVEDAIRTIEVLRLEPNDVLVIRCHERISDETAHRLKAHFEGALRDVLKHKILVIPDSLELKVVRPSELPAELL